jgi:hypothetical protein
MSAVSTANRKIRNRTRILVSKYKNEKQFLLRLNFFFKQPNAAHWQLMRMRTARITSDSILP